jgi:hypothetical protein
MKNGATLTDTYKLLGTEATKRRLHPSQRAWDKYMDSWELSAQKIVECNKLTAFLESQVY